MRKSETKTIIGAMRILSVDIQSGDGVANLAISEAADRLQELHDTNAMLNDLTDSQLQTINALKKRLQGLTAKYGIDGRTTGLDKFCAEYDKERASAKCKKCYDTGQVYSNEPDGYYYDCPDCINAADKEAY